AGASGGRWSSWPQPRRPGSGPGATGASTRRDGRRRYDLRHMRIPFHASPRASLGIEVELGIVDLETRELAPAAADLLTEVGRGHPEGEHPKAKHELFQSTVEIITGVCTTVAEGRADLQATLDEVRGAARAR